MRKRGPSNVGGAVQIIVSIVLTLRNKCLIDNTGVAELWERKIKGEHFFPRRQFLSTL